MKIYLMIFMLIFMISICRNRELILKKHSVVVVWYCIVPITGAVFGIFLLCDELVS